MLPPTRKESATKRYAFKEEIKGGLGGVFICGNLKSDWSAPAFLQLLLLKKLIYPYF